MVLHEICFFEHLTFNDSDNPLIVKLDKKATLIFLLKLFISNFSESKIYFDSGSSLSINSNISILP